MPSPKNNNNIRRSSADTKAAISCKGDMKITAIERSRRWLRGHNGTSRQSCLSLMCHLRDNERAYGGTANQRIRLMMRFDHIVRIGVASGSVHVGMPSKAR